MLRSLLLLTCLPLCSQEAEVGKPQPAAADAAKPGKPSPWMLVPLVSSSPKLGTSLGVMGAYVTRLDPDSPPTMLGVTYQYTSTDSQIGGVFLNSFFKGDQHRLAIGLAGGTVNNQYEDFGGTGLTVRSRDDLRLAAVRYYTRVARNWYVGAQGVKTNYVVSGEDALSDGILAAVGLTGYNAVGLGLVAQYDSKDDKNNPTRGQSVQLNQLSYREALGGSSDFDQLGFKWKAYLPAGAGQVLALQSDNRWTRDAPPSGLSSVKLRGYTQGEYLGADMSSLEGELRLVLNPRWGVKAFTGAAVLYGPGREPSGLFPMAGAGCYYVLRPQDGIVLSLEAAWGKDSNHGYYLNFGHSF